MTAHSYRHLLRWTGLPCVPGDDMGTALHHDLAEDLRTPHSAVAQAVFGMATTGGNFFIFCILAGRYLRSWTI